MKGIKLNRVSEWGTVLVILLLGLAACAPAAAPTAAIPVTGATNTPAPAASATQAMLVTPVAGAPSPANGATITVVTKPGLGKILVGPTGMTLYAWTADTAGVSTCTGQCAQTWPPLSVASGASPVLGTGIQGTLSQIKRPDGTLQVALNGIPLYYFAGDKAPGDTKGQGIAGKWYVVGPRANLMKNPFRPGTPTRTATPAG